MATRRSTSNSRRASSEKKINNNNNNVFLLLPFEIIVDIFSRLAVASVSQCKVVCKTWRNLIAAEHPSIVDKHKEGFLLRLPDKDEAGFHYGSYDDKVTYFNLTGKTILNHYPFQDAKKWFIMGSCNGLICLSSHCCDDMYVCNPYEGEYAKLPNSNPNNPRRLKLDRYHRSFKIAAYGFGYHPITEEYKVIRIYYHEKSFGCCSAGQVQVYTLGSGTSAWRNIGKIEHKLYKTHLWEKDGILLNGVLYWFTRNKKLIISFDLGYEEFRDIQTPSELFGLSVLVVLNGCLCVSTAFDDGMHIWMMNNEDYSWIKKFSISWKYEGIFNPHYPLAQLENSKLLLHRDFYEIISYDLETKHFVKLKKMDHSMFDIIPYMKNSISLKALGEKKAIQVKAKGEEENKIQKKKEWERRSKKRNKLIV